MKQLVRRIRGALGMGLTWAIAWAVIGGGIMEGIVDRDGQILDMWPQTLAIPGFLGGVVFSALLWASEGRRRFDELSLPRFAGWGALAGAMLGGLALGAGALPGVGSLWLRAAVLMGPVAVMSAASAAGSLAAARWAAARELPTGGGVAAELGDGDGARQLTKGR